VTLREKNLLVKCIYEKWAVYEHDRYKRDTRQWLKEILEEVEVGCLHPLTREDHQELLSAVERKILMRLKQAEIAADVQTLARYLFSSIDLSEAPGSYFSGSYGLEMWIQANDDIEGNPNGNPGAGITVSADKVKLVYGDGSNPEEAVGYLRHRDELTPLSKKEIIKDSIINTLVTFFSSI
jgi:hypothetical protein